MSESPVLGIDLGTTFSAMSVVDRYGKAIIVPNADGHPTTPSVVHFYDRDACIVGEEAIKMVVADPMNVARFIKRAMGEADYQLEYFDRSYSPQEISGIILRKLKEDAEEALGRPIRDAVITVPAYFDSAQRGATAEAGELAGLNVLSIINEPTAAAIAYGIDRLGPKRHLLVFDLGGGTFDVTLMELEGISFKTIQSDGNAELGGKDWDDRLVNYVAEQFEDRYGIDPRDEPQPYQELYERCLAAKIALSSKPRAVVPVNYRGNRTIVKISREQFEELTADLVSQCEETCQIILERAGMDWKDLDEVLLVGGSTRMPMIRETLRRLSGRIEASGMNPDECVALGAALAGVLRHRPDNPAMLARRKALTRRALAAARGLEIDDPEVQALDNDSVVPRVEIRDITTHPLGIVVLDKEMQERVVPLIPAATEVPCEKRGRFAYAYDGMTAVRVEITEGAGKSREEVRLVGEVILEDLPPRPRGTAIDVTYRYNINQILEVDVMDVETRAFRRARIDLRGGIGADRKAEAQRNVAQAHIT